MNESFSSRAKREICKVEPGNTCCAAAECYGSLLLGNTFSPGLLRVVTTHPPFAGRLCSLLEAAFSVNAERQGGDERKITISVTGERDINRVRESFGYGINPELALHINFAVLERECCHPAFWRGAFLSGGTVSSPESKYQLELLTPHRTLARELSALLRESGFSPRHAERTGIQVLYFKQSEMIEDFLTFVGAPVAAMEIMQQKVEKDLRNNANRRVNCDTANVDKTIAAAVRLREEINALERSGRLENLPEALLRTAKARLDYPEDSLVQLSERLGVSKSCLNHRLRKLTLLAKE